MPIGNLTSQIFANIYLNELDRFVKHELKVKNYLRYGDDFIVVEPDLQRLKTVRVQVIQFLTGTLRLTLNSKNNQIIKTKQGLRFLGVVIYSKRRKLNKINWKRIKNRLNDRNISSYSGLIRQHGNSKNRKEFHWRIGQALL